MKENSLNHPDHDHNHHDHDHHDHDHGKWAKIKSFFIGHSHSSTEMLDQALTSSEQGIRAIKVSLAILACTALIELVIVFFSNSISLLGDSIHNFADALTALPLGIAFWLQRKPPTKRYTYGYGRAEDLAGIFIILVVAISLVFTTWIAISRLMHPQPVQNIDWVIVGALVGFIGNETVAIYRTKVGVKIGSAALVADGAHAKTDGLTSLAVLIGAIGSMFGFKLADPIVALVISVIILGVLKGATKEIYQRLMDSVDPKLLDQVEHVLSQVEGVQSIDKIRIRWVGHNLLAEARLTSDGNLSLTQAHAIAEEAHHQLLHKVPRLSEALIHSDPTDSDYQHHKLTAHHFLKD